MAGGSKCDSPSISQPRGARSQAGNVGRQSDMRRNVQIIGWTLIWSGIFIFGYLGWQLYGTDVVNARVQAEAMSTLERRMANAGTPWSVKEVEEAGRRRRRACPRGRSGRRRRVRHAAGPQSRVGGRRLRRCDHADPGLWPRSHAGDPASRATWKRSHFRASDHPRSTLPRLRPAGRRRPRRSGDRLLEPMSTRFGSRSSWPRPTSG